MALYRGYVGLIWGLHGDCSFNNSYYLPIAMHCHGELLQQRPFLRFLLLLLVHETEKKSNSLSMGVILSVFRIL